MNLYQFTKATQPSDSPISTKDGTLVAIGFSQIVHGGRGAYVEFLDDQIERCAMHIPSGAEWRVNHPFCYYIEFGVAEEKVRVYLQKRIVDYAAYVVGRWYISPIQLRDFEVAGVY